MRIIDNYDAGNLFFSDKGLPQRQKRKKIRKGDKLGKLNSLCALDKEWHEEKEMEYMGEWDEKPNSQHSQL